MSNSFLTMIKTTALAALLFFSCGLNATPARAEGVGDYLILRDVGVYALEKSFIAPGGVVVGGGEPSMKRCGNEAEGFYASYSVGYDGGENYAGPNVEIRVYDSTQWIAHEIEEPFRDGEMETLGLLTDRSVLRKFEANKVYMIAIGGETFRWLSGNILVEISHVDLQAEKPEPLEVVRAYLQKYPSTIDMSDAQLKDQDHTKQWIKEEFERLLWVSERWVSLLKDGDAQNKEKLRTAAKHLEEFANYRKAYFKPLFGHALDKDIELLQTAHMRPGQEEFIRAKLADYQKWWAGHRNSSIDLP